MATIKYLIADDHKIFCKGIRLILSPDKELVFVGEAEDGLALLEMIPKLQPDVILLDIRMPNMDGKEAMARIKQGYPSIKVLVLSMYEEEQMIAHMMMLGANGYLLKNAEPQEIMDAIHSVYENNIYFNKLVSNSLLLELLQKGKLQPTFKEDQKLSEGEKKVLRLICKQRTNGEIAAELFLGLRTVEGHVQKS